MEREMNVSAEINNRTLNEVDRENKHDVVLEFGIQVSNYLHALGLVDQYLINQLVEECLSNAKRHTPDDEHDYLLKYALEEAQRRIDQAIARALRLQISRDQKPISAARAAMLLSEGSISVDALFLSPEASDEAITRILEVLPQAVPPEEPLEMKPAQLCFWLFRSA